MQPTGYPASAGYETAAVRMDQFAPLRAAWTGENITTNTHTHNTAHRAGRPVNGSQVAKDTEHTTRHTARAHR